MAFWKWFAIAALWVGLLFGMCGCAAFDANSKGESDPDLLDARMSALERGGFKGRISVDTGGSPLQWVSKQTMGFGPENNAFHAEGEIDFSRGSVNSAAENQEVEK